MTLPPNAVEFVPPPVDPKELRAFTRELSKLSGIPVTFMVKEILKVTR